MCYSRNDIKLDLEAVCGSLPEQKVKNEIHLPKPMERRTQTETFLITETDRAWVHHDY